MHPGLYLDPVLQKCVAGGIIIGLQVFLLFSGNLSFLNWLTIVPAMACFDDVFLSRLLPKPLIKRAEKAALESEESKSLKITSWIITGFLALLSVQPVLNILSPGQIMNTSFDPLDLVNTYGAFGYVGKERLNVVFEGTTNAAPDNNAVWTAYPYRGLPVALDQRPPQIAPYQLRLDWQMWFASMSSPEEYPWTLTLISKLLVNDPETLGLFAENPFPDKPPRLLFVRYYIVIDLRKRMRRESGGREKKSVNGCLPCRKVMPVYC